MYVCYFFLNSPLLLLGISWLAHVDCWPNVRVASDIVYCDHLKLRSQLGNTGMGLKVQTKLK